MGTLASAHAAGTFTADRPLIRTPSRRDRPPSGPARPGCDPDVAALSPGPRGVAAARRKLGEFGATLPLVLRGKGRAVAGQCVVRASVPMLDGCTWPR